MVQSQTQRVPLPELLICWSGKDSEPTAVIGNVELVDGPILQFLCAPEHRERFQACIVLHVPQTRTDVRLLEQALARRSCDVPVIPLEVELSDPTDYQAIQQAVMGASERIAARFPHDDFKWNVLLNSGTPQMRTSWLVLSASGALAAKLYQGVPAQIAKEQNVPLCHEVNARRALGTHALPRSMHASRNKLAELNQEAQSEFSWDISALALGGSSQLVRNLRTQLYQAAQRPGVLCLRGEPGSGQRAAASRYFRERLGSSPEIAWLHAHEPQAIEQVETLIEKAPITPALAGSGQIRRDKEGGQAIALWCGATLPHDVVNLLARADRADTPLILCVESGVSLAESIPAHHATFLESLMRDALFFPPLRSRKKELPWLASRVVEAWQRWFSPPALPLLQDYPWPGNFPEFERVLSRLAMRGEGAIRPEDFPDYIRFEPPVIPKMAARITQIEVQMIEEALHSCNGNRSAAARQLGISRSTLLSRLR